MALNKPQGNFTYSRDIPQDEDLFYDESSISSTHSTAATHHHQQHHHHPHLAEMHRCSQPKMPPYPFGGYMVPSQARQDCRETASLMRPRRTSEYPILPGITQYICLGLSITQSGTLGAHSTGAQSTRAFSILL